jgi:HAD superfamily hydrolase (TIGR01509 family)
MSHATQLVVFDIGRVMIGLVSGWPDACVRAGVAVPKEIESAQIRAGLHALIYQLETGRMSDEAYLEQVGVLVGASAKDVHAVMIAWLREPYDGLEALVEEIHGRGMKTACLSNTNSIHWGVLMERLPLGRMHYRFASHLMGAFKPEPGIYEAVEKETGIGAGGIVFFDDLEANCEGARVRGWRAHQILHVEGAKDPVGQMRGHLGF